MDLTNTKHNTDNVNKFPVFLRKKRDGRQKPRHPAAGGTFTYFIAGPQAFINRNPAITGIFK